MISRLKKGNTFCVLPWIEYHTRTDGEQYFCCWAEKSVGSEKAAAATRQQILNNEPVAHCNNCYKLEASNVISPRQRESAIWLRDAAIREKFKHNPQYDPIFLDLRLDNKCNLACIGCNPKYSTLWQKELLIPIKRYSTLPDFTQIINAKKIYMAGGEPFIIDSYLNIIDFIANNNPDIELVINTNLTTLPDSTLNSLQKIKQVSITVSIDAYDKVNEYHRYPLKWTKFIRNLDKLYDTGLRIDFNTVIDAVSVFGLTELKLLEKYVDQWNIQVLTDPAALRIENLPELLKPIALENVKSLKNLKFYTTDQKFKTKVDYIITTIDKKGNHAELSRYIQQLDLRRNINHYDFLGVNLIEA
jgi:MoaA/NifB/PqqE/SkfB family radical SAM enzyme